MTVKLYRLPHLQSFKNNALSFTDLNARDAFFNNVANQTTVSTGDTTVGRITDLGKLYQEVTIFTNGRNPYTLYNYLVIEDSIKHYYYIVDYKEVGNTQVVYYLKKDTFMTHVAAPNSGIHLGSLKSLVTREHKPRFNFGTNHVLYDRVPEPGDNTTPKVVSDNPFNIYTRARFVYKNRTDSKPVAYPYVENTTSVTVTGSDWIGTVYSQLQDLDTTELMYTWDGNFQYTLGEGVPNITIAVPSGQYVKYNRSGTGTRRLTTYNKSDGVFVSEILNVPSGRDLKIKVGNRGVQLLLAVNEYVPPGRTWAYLTTNFDPINYAATSTKSLPLWSAIDQYDAMTDRIVEVPYFVASNFTFYEDGYGIFIPLESNADINLSMTFTRRPLGGVFDTSRVDKNRVPYNDPKLYTSQFSPFMFIMNGAVIGLKRESRAGGFPFTGAETTTVNFNYELLTPSSFRLKVTPPGTYEIEDADELRQIWDVNNEIASIKDDAYTYNQYYKDLDDKQRRIQESAAWRNTTLNAVNQTLGVVGGMIAGGKATPVQIAARAGQAGINIAQSWMDLADQRKLNDVAAKQKYIGLLLASTQISGASLNFLKSFGGDRIRALQFSLTNEDLDYWDERFHKFGYQCLEYKVPVLRTRKYFDYKEIIIDEFEQSADITDEVALDLRQRFADGITIYHVQADGSVDWAQSKENWEI